MKLQKIIDGSTQSGYNLVPESKQEEKALRQITELYDENKTNSNKPIDCLIQTVGNESTITKIIFLPKSIVFDDIDRKIIGVKDFDPTNLLICSKCGSADVDVKAWVNANTNEYNGEAGDGSIEDYYCNECEEHVRLKEKKVRKPKKRKNNDKTK